MEFFILPLIETLCPNRRGNRRTERNSVFLPLAVAQKEHIWGCYYSWSRNAGEVIHPKKKWKVDKSPNTVGFQMRCKSR